MILTVGSVTYTNRSGPMGYDNCVYKNEGFIDVFYSLIWVERYNEAGEFELKIETSDDNIRLLKEDRYIKADFSDYIMIIEKIELVSDFEDGDYMLVSGRSLESILDRRIVYNRLQFTGDAKGNTYTVNDKATHPAMVRNVIDTLIYNNFIIDPNRSMYEFGAYNTDSYSKVSPTQEELKLATNHPFLEMYVSASIYGESCYDAICKICQELGIGFKMDMTANASTGTKFKLSLYYGLNLTSDLEKNQSGKVVTFSPLFNNLLTSDYIIDKRDYKNFVKVDGIWHEESGGQYVEKEVSEDVLGQIISGKNFINPVSTERRETYLDANNVSDKIHYNLIISNNSGSAAIAYFDTDADRDKYLSATNYAGTVKFTYYTSFQWLCDAFSNRQYTTAELHDIFGITVNGSFADQGYFTTYASYIEQNNTTERIITESGFKNRLNNEGKGTLIEREYLEDVTTEVLPDITYSYGKTSDDDYYLGDVVTFMDKYGSILNCRITEMTTSIDEDGIKREPTFLPVSSNLNQSE